jgi:hypothetical protein
MEFGLRAGFLAAIVAFTTMRPIHTRNVGATILAALSLYPYRLDQLVDDPKELVESSIIFYYYIVTLVLLRLLSLAMAAVHHLVLLFWQYSGVVCIIALLLALRALFKDKLDAEHMQWIAAKLANGLSMSLSRGRLLAWYYLWKLGTILQFLRLQLSTSRRVGQILGRTPFGELSPSTSPPMDPGKQAREESTGLPSQQASVPNPALSAPQPSSEIEDQRELVAPTVPPSSRSRSASHTHSQFSTFDLSMYEDLDPSNPAYRALLNGNVGFNPRHGPGQPRKPIPEVLYVSNGPGFTSRPAYWPYERPYREGDFKEGFCRNRKRSQ